MTSSSLSARQGNYRITVIITALITAIGGIVRIWGIDMGLESPGFYADEYYYVRNGLYIPARLLGLSAPWGPLPQAYPILIGFCYGLFYSSNRVLGIFQSTADLIELFVADPAPLYLVARVLSAIFSIATIPLARAVAVELFDRKTGFIATLFVAFCYPLVLHAKRAHATSMVIFMTTLGFLFIARVYRNGRTSDYVWTGLSIGIGIGTKYTPAVLFLPLVIAHMLRERHGSRTSARQLGIALLVSLAALILSFPLLLLDPVRVARDMISVNQRYTQAGNVLVNVWNMLFGLPSEYWVSTSAEPIPYVTNSMQTLSLPLLMCVLAGLGYCFVRFPKRTALLALSTLAVFLYVAVPGQWQLGVRQTYIGLPAFLILAAAFLTDICNRLRVTLLTQRSILAVVVCLILIQSALFTVRLAWLYARPTTIELARAWVLNNIPPETVIGIDPQYTPFVKYSTQLQTAGDDSGTGLLRPILSKYSTGYEIRWLYAYEGRWSPPTYESIVDEGIQIVIVADYQYMRYFDDPGITVLEHQSDPNQFYTTLFTQAKLVQRFDPKKLWAAGPTIAIYRIP